MDRQHHMHPFTDSKALNEKGVRIITKADGERTVTWGEVIRKSRVATVDRSTAAKHMHAELGVKPQRPRAKLTRNDIDEATRKRIANKLRKFPLKYWTTGLHLVMDNKRWPFPRSLR